MNHWAKKYIGKPWVRLARGPDAFDCWGLICDVYKKQYNIHLAANLIDPINMKAYAVAITEGKDHPDWIEADEPFEGCVVPLSTSKLFHHVGIWLDIDGGLILHAQGKSFVVAQTIKSLKSAGWRKFKFYYHKEFQKV